MISIREQMRVIHDRYANSTSQISRKHKVMISKLKKQEAALTRRSAQLKSTMTQSQDAGDPGSLVSWKQIPHLLNMLTPFRIALGIGCAVTSFLIVFGVLINNLDRFMNSECGFVCGYSIDKLTLFNPLDFILVQTSKLFPLDFLLLGCLQFYFFVTCLYGIIKLGIPSPATGELFTLKRRATSPLTLILTSFLVILMMLSFSMQLLTIAP